MKKNEWTAFWVGANQGFSLFCFGLGIFTLIYFGSEHRLSSFKDVLILFVCQALILESFKAHSEMRRNFRLERQMKYIKRS